MTSVLERAARSVADVMAKRRNGRTTAPWWCSPERDEALQYVRAVILALREPSEAMVEDGHWKITGGESNSERDARDARNVWRAMIDAALAEGG